MSAAASVDPANGIPSISVVIPTYNNSALLAECLQAVQRMDYPADRLEVIVVDNASTDRTRELMERRFRWARLVSLETNTGFAAACNKGAETATSDYIAFLNNDAVPDTQWLNALLRALEAGPEGTVCAASRIVSRDGNEVEYDGAGSNLFAAGRPHSTWGWPDLPDPPGPGTPVLFASGGAMLINRAVFIETGGFDPEYFAYFEDVDLGWRLWLLGYTVVYAPEAVVRHIGGATGRRAGAHKRYTLWESNSLATVIKNYETGNMERIVAAALMLTYKRALLATGDAVNPADYALTAPRDTNRANVERLPKVSVAHLVAIDRLNAMLAHLMGERRRIQALRRRSDRDILPLLGSLYAPQFAGREYAEAAVKLAEAAGLFAITDPTVPPRALLLTTPNHADQADNLAATLASHVTLAVAVVGVEATPSSGTATYTRHGVTTGSAALKALVEGADVVLLMGDTARLDEVRATTTPIASLGTGVVGAEGYDRLDPSAIDEVIAYCLRRGLQE
jgi:GT2 family glycosyltransferase